MNKKFYGLLALSILLLVFVAVPVFATHSWGGYHWARSANPVSLTVGDNVSSAWDSYLDVALSDWNQSAVLDLTKVASSGSTRKCSSSNNIEVCNNTYGNTGWLGIAGISVSGTHITSAYTKMNDTYFNTATYDTPGWRQMVMCQEVGHAFGLDHQDEAFDNPNLGTCMDYTNDPTRNDGSGNNLHPNKHDYDELDTIYSHLDGSSGGGGNCHGNNPKCNNGANNNGINPADYSSPAEWGHLVRQNGRIAVYERDFGNGNKVLTMVIWAN